MDESAQRITKTTAAFMITVAALFDLGQVASKILTVLGLTVAGGIIGVIVCNYLNINAAGTCAAGGVLVGGIASLTGVGTAIALKVGMLMSWLVDWLFTITGYSTMGLWFLSHGVSPFMGKNPSGKIVTFLVSFLLDSLPLLSFLPGLTVWTIIMILQTRREDKEEAQEAKRGYNNGKNTMRLGRTKVSQEESEEAYATANTY